MPNAPRRFAAAFALAVALVVVTAPGLARAYDDRYDQSPRYEQSRSRAYNDEYIFATTRMISEWDVHPAIKVPLFPPAVVIDVVFLPAEVIAGLF